MLLESNVFNAVIGGLESDARRGTRGAAAIRGSFLSTRLTILPCPQGVELGIGAPLSVPVRDLSRGGLRFLLPRRLPLDTQFIAILPGSRPELSVATAQSMHGSQFEAPPATNSAEWLSPESVEPDISDNLTIDPNLPPLMVLCGVAYWQPLAKDLFAIGGQFMRTIEGIAIPDVEPRIVLPGESDTDAGVVPTPIRRAS